MRTRVLIGSAIACLVAITFTALVFEIKLEHAIILAPVIVLSFGALAGLIVLWSRIAWESLKHRRHPWRIVAGGILAFALLLVLSFFVGPLPHE